MRSFQGKRAVRLSPNDRGYYDQQQRNEYHPTASQQDDFA
jgi:hypothetical protein